jgi:hypothetical protein
MIKILKRLKFVAICGLFIPFSTITSLIWLGISLTSSIIGYVTIPIEYIITGDTEWCEKLMDFFWKYLPKLYNKRTELFFKFIHPENN